jgi:hypothetical protein
LSQVLHLSCVPVKDMAAIELRACCTCQDDTSVWLAAPRARGRQATTDRSTSKRARDGGEELSPRSRFGGR